MKHLAATLLLAAASSIAVAQNVQLHYDLGHAIYGKLSGRPNVTTTVEMFKPDKWGSTYLFTDIDYYGDGAAGAYWEFGREFSFGGKRRWAARLEYNGGATSLEHTEVASRFQHALLAGLAWNWASEDFSKIFSVRAMYKQYFNGYSRHGFPGFQVTAVWENTFARGLCSFNGFIDVWRDKDVDGQLIVLAEPQFWVNLNAASERMKNVKLSLGTEVEISNNFVFDDQGRNNKFFAIPTIAAKWTF